MQNKNKNWWRDAVFYQIYPLSFQDSDGDGIGDIPGIIARLDYLQDLGIGAIWLSPVQRSPMIDNGYDISDYESIDPLFGSLSDFERLIIEAHERDIRIIMDLVINHTSSAHPWFLSSRQDRDNAYADYYIWHDPRDGREPNNWASDLGTSAWTWAPEREQYYLHSFSSHQPDLNWQNPQVKEEIFSMMHRWLARGVDGFRIDMGNFLIKADGLPDAERHDGDSRDYIHGEDLYANQPGIHELYQEIQRDVLAPYGAIAIGEMYFLTPEEMIRYTDPAREEINMVYFYQVMDARGDWTQTKHLLRKWHDQTKNKSTLTLTFSNHDSPRSLSLFGDVKNYSLASSKLIHTFLLTSPVVPFLLQGEEIGMTGTDITDAEGFTDLKMRTLYERRIAAGEDPHRVFTDLAWWNRDHARTPMQWSADLHGGFSTSAPWLPINQNHATVNVTDQEKNPYSLLVFIKSLIQLRKEHLTLIHGDFTSLHPDEWAMWACRRTYGDETIYILYNFSSTTNTIGLHEELKKERDNLTLLLSNYLEPSPLTDNLTFAPWEVQILRKEKSTS